MKIKNIKYNSIGTIDCELEHEKYGWIPFTAAPDDVEEFGRNIYREAKEGNYGDIAPYIPYIPTAEEKALEVRAERDSILVELDMIVTNPLRWASLSEEQQQMLAVYRQELLDVPQQAGFPDSVEWPEAPMGGEM